MLSEIYVKDLALLEEVRVSLKPGMNVVTGETGAGKSLFVQAILLLQGARSNQDLIRSQAKEAIVEGVFDITDNSQLIKLLLKKGIEETQLIIRRHLSRDGRNRIYLNGVSLSLNELKEFIIELLEVTGQHESQKLLDPKSQQELFDGFCFQNKKVLLEKYQLCFEKFKDVQQALKEEETRLQAREREESILRFQLEEIEKAKLTSETEEDELLQKKTFAKNRDALQKMCDLVFESIEGGEGSVLSHLKNIKLRIDKLSATDASLEEASKFIDEAEIPLAELSNFFHRYESALPSASLSLDTIESRLFELQKLRRKYGSNLKEVIECRNHLQSELKKWESSDERLETLKKEFLALGEALLSMAGELSGIRKQGAASLKKKVEKELKDLAMGSGEFSIELETPQKPQLTDLTARGYDAITFKMSANPGEPLKDLSKIASGGELSRLMLAIKKVFLMDSSAFCVFDEIDTGIGGEIANKVGDKLKEISQKGQTLVVTHLPQIAARADHHFNIQKLQNKSHTQTVVTYLEAEADREEEIARMVGGTNLGAASRKLAKEMRLMMK